MSVATSDACRGSLPGGLRGGSQPLARPRQAPGSGRLRRAGSGERRTLVAVADCAAIAVHGGRRRTLADHMWPVLHLGGRDRPGPRSARAGSSRPTTPTASGWPRSPRGARSSQTRPRTRTRARYPPGSRFCSACTAGRVHPRRVRHGRGRPHRPSTPDRRQAFAGQVSEHDRGVIGCLAETQLGPPSHSRGACGRQQRWSIPGLHTSWAEFQLPAGMRPKFEDCTHRGTPSFRWPSFAFGGFGKPRRKPALGAPKALTKSSWTAAGVSAHRLIHRGVGTRTVLRSKPIPRRPPPGSTTPVVGTIAAAAFCTVSSVAQTRSAGRGCCPS